MKEEPPLEQELQKLVSEFQIPIRKLFNTSGMLYRDLKLKDCLDSYSQSSQIKLLSSNGMLVKRPLCLLEDGALIGFKEKEWKERLGE